MKVTEETQQSVLDLLAESPLTETAFDHGFNLEDGTMVSIKLKGQEHFFYTLHQSEIEGKQWEVRESPGPFFHGAETSQFATLDEAIAYVGDWLGRTVAQVTQSKRKATRE